MRPFTLIQRNSNQRYLIKIALLFLLIALAKSCEFDHSSESLKPSQTVLLISLDGFAAHYLNTAEVPTLDSLIRTGAVAASLIPVFPSKTFPNHYTQVTGLYPQNHGIISNRMYDRRFHEYFTIGSSSVSARDGKWYQGEPIWVTAQRQGLHAASMFWPGSDAQIKDIRPNYYFPFNGSITPQERIDQVLSWLSKGSQRPHLITLYFEQIDQAGHIHGPNTKPVRDEISRLDGKLGELLEGIVELELTDFINLVIISDHGMAPQSRDRVIFLDDYISLDQVEIINWSPLLELIPHQAYEKPVFDALKDAHPHLKVFLKRNTPIDWHFRHHHRITPILGLADPGWSISSRAYYQQHPMAYQGGTHGYDPKETAMHGIFIASGPAFRSGTEIGSTESVHLYELLCRILEVEPAKNDGNLKVWEQILR